MVCEKVNFLAGIIFKKEINLKKFHLFYLFIFIIYHYFINFILLVMCFFRWVIFWKTTFYICWFYIWVKWKEKLSLTSLVEAENGPAGQVLWLGRRCVKPLLIGWHSEFEDQLLLKPILSGNKALFHLFQLITTHIKITSKAILKWIPMKKRACLAVHWHEHMHLS